VFLSRRRNATRPEKVADIKPKISTSHLPPRPPPPRDSWSLFQLNTSPDYPRKVLVLNTQPFTQVPSPPTGLKTKFRIGHPYINPGQGWGEGGGWG